MTELQNWIYEGEKEEPRLYHPRKEEGVGEETKGLDLICLHIVVAGSP